MIREAVDDLAPLLPPEMRSESDITWRPGTPLIDYCVQNEIEGRFQPRLPRLQIPRPKKVFSGFYYRRDVHA